MLAYCSFCNSTGEILVTRPGINPNSGVQVHDPQNDDIVPCPRCTGVRLPVRGRLDRATVEHLASLAQTDLRRAA